MAIIALVIGAMLPAVGTFFDSARGPNARNLISASLTNARNYAVANNVTTALIFTEDDDPSGSPRRTLMFLVQDDGSDTNSFELVDGQEPTHLPDDIMLRNDPDPDDNDPVETVAICFLPVGQLTTLTIAQIELPDPPGGGPIPAADIEEQTDIGIYDYVASTDDPEMELYINYYTGAVIEE